MPGTRSYKQPLDFLVWSHCYLELAYKAPPFYPEEFEVAATAILEELNMNREVMQDQFIGTCVIQCHHRLK